MLKQWKIYRPFHSSTIKPGLDYFSSKFEIDMKDIIAAFKPVQLLLRPKIAEIRSDPIVVEDL